GLARDEPLIEQEHLVRLEELVASYTGLHTRSRDREALQRGAAAGMKRQGLSRPEEYLRLLGADTGEAAAEWKRLATHLTNPESPFLRDRTQMALLRDTVLPELTARNRAQRRLRLWSAGCSTGQEPYSLAILLQEVLPDRERWDISILGTDI